MISVQVRKKIINLFWLSNWKIKQYVLSMTIPNNHTDEVVKIKSLIEDKEIEKLKKANKSPFFLFIDNSCLFCY
jgi:hypothetical protein